jgi:hypothetical protein
MEVPYHQRACAMPQKPQICYCALHLMLQEEMSTDKCLQTSNVSSTEKCNWREECSVVTDLCFALSVVPV